MALRHNPLAFLIVPFCSEYRFTTVAKSPESSLGDLLLVASIAKTLSKPGGIHTLDKDGDSIPLSEELVLQILRRGSLDAARKLDFFRWCSLRHNYKHSTCTYSQMFGSICFLPNHHYNDILELLASMRRDGLTLDSSTLKLILDGFIKSGKYDSTLGVLDYVERELIDKRRLSPDAYSPIVVALVRKNQLLVSLKKSGMKDKFMEVFGKLRATKLYPLDRWGYNICIHMLGCWGDLSIALSLFKEMKGKSGSFDPDLCTCNSLIHVLCSLGKVKDALTMWEELKSSSGHEPDSYTYRILIQGCCKSYRINDALQIFSEMQYNGVRAETVVYNSLLDGLLKSRKLNEACNLFDKMVDDDGVRASCWTYNILIDGLLKNGRPEAAYTLFSNLKKKGNNFVDSVSYSIVILHACREVKIEEALKLVEEMEARGFVVDLITITSLLTALYRRGLWDLIEKLMRKHLRDGNLVLSILKWKSAMEGSLKSPQSKDKDLMPIFPSTNHFSSSNYSFHKPHHRSPIMRHGRRWRKMALLHNPLAFLIVPFCSEYRFTTAAKSPASSLGDLLLVASIAKTLSKPGGIHTLDRDGDSIPLSKELVLQILHRGSLDPARKLDFFRWCSLRHNYKHSTDTYSQMFRFICFLPNHHYNDILELLASMRRDGLTLDSSTLKLILDGFIRSGKYDSALEVLDYVERELIDKRRLSPDAYSPIVVAVVRKNQISLALSIFLKLLNSSTVGDSLVIPDAIACNELLVSLKKSGMKDEFMEVFSKLRATKLYPLDRWGYNICIHTLGCWGDEGEKWFVRSGFVTYNSLIHVLCSLGKVKDALTVWEEVKSSSGHEPDSYTYRILIQGCCKSYRINDALQIFSEMQYNGVRAETVVYNSLLDGLLKSRKLNEACNLFEKMVDDDGVRASCWTYNILIDGLLKNGRPEVAYTLFSDLKKKGNNFVDSVSYSIVILHVCRDGKIEEALKLVEEMEARGFVVDLVTITSLLTALYRRGLWDLTEKLMRKHIRDGNLVLSILK
ncbi:pentatricopeptide repeat-containing family protein [Striga asiatica]|uniref:Pentatricopeptide repeat-containing family protein n=1 Tax=Striga asiatica TaxID=4170 RepID=A0A5A7RDI9_STRAF|nr:pentatricopeptide repeat-containing family protein [Striga asiatica]